LTEVSETCCLINPFSAVQSVNTSWLPKRMELILNFFIKYIMLLMGWVLVWPTLTKKGYQERLHKNGMAFFLRKQTKEGLKLNYHGWLLRDTNQSHHLIPLFCDHDKKMLCSGQGIGWFLSMYWDWSPFFTIIFLENLEWITFVSLYGMDQ
jgi:hypothetical protein